MIRSLLPLLLLSLACTPKALVDTVPHDTSVPDTDETDLPDTDTDTDTDTDSDTDLDTDTDPIAEHHPSLQDYPCFHGEECAPDGPYLTDTCCAVGVNLDPVGTARAEEAVDLEVDDDFIVACGGFGARISARVESGAAPFIDAVAQRCQRLTLGTPATDGTRLLVVAHHGDSWVKEPRLEVYELSSVGTATQLEQLADPDVLFEGVRLVGRDLFVAAHASGLRVYTVGSDGKLSATGSLGGFTNASKLELAGSTLWVTDANRLHAIDITVPTKPTRLGSVTLPAVARDVAVAGDRAYVALGSDGFATVDVSDPTAPVLDERVDTEGSIQAVSVDGELLGLAAWTHVQLRNADTLTLLATAQTRASRSYEQDLGIVLRDDKLYVAEWEGVHQLAFKRGYVQPDLFLAESMMNFSNHAESWSTIQLRNRGPLPLDVSAVLSDPSFRAEPAGLELPPKETATLKVFHTPPGPDRSPTAELEILTSDPDPLQARVSVPLYASPTSRLNVGETITDVFGFLDPTGADKIDNLRGKVTVVAYFALF